MQVLPFFRDLESLPERPDIDTLRKVFSWYDDGFLKGVDVEADPAAAWRECGPSVFSRLSLSLHPKVIV